MAVTPAGFVALDEAALPDDQKWQEAREFLDMALRVAGGFPEVEVALLNSRSHRALAKRVGLATADPWPDCTVQVFYKGQRLHATDFQAEGIMTFSAWLEGIVLGKRLRAINSRYDADHFLGYRMGQRGPWLGRYRRTDNKRLRGGWNKLRPRFAMQRINDQDGYSIGGACTNAAESYFSR